MHVGHTAMHVGHINSKIATATQYHLFREHYKEYKDDESLQADEDGVDVGHKEEVSVEDQDANDPRDAHDNHQRDGGLQPVPGGEADM